MGLQIIYVSKYCGKSSNGCLHPQIHLPVNLDVGKDKREMKIPWGFSAEVVPSINSMAF